MTFRVKAVFDVFSGQLFRWNHEFASGSLEEFLKIKHKMRGHELLMHVSVIQLLFVNRSTSLTNTEHLNKHLRLRAFAPKLPHCQFMHVHCVSDDVRLHCVTVQTHTVCRIHVDFCIFFQFVSDFFTLFAFIAFFSGSWALLLLLAMLCLSLCLSLPLYLSIDFLLSSTASLSFLPLHTVSLSLSPSLWLKDFERFLVLLLPLPLHQFLKHSLGSCSPLVSLVFASISFISKISSFSSSPFLIANI